MHYSKCFTVISFIESDYTMIKIKKEGTISLVNYIDAIEQIPFNRLVSVLIT